MDFATVKQVERYKKAKYDPRPLRAFCYQHGLATKFLPAASGRGGETAYPRVAWLRTQGVDLRLMEKKRIR